MAAPTSHNLRAFAVGLYFAANGPQAVWQVVGDSINNASYSLGMTSGYRDKLRMPFNGWTIMSSSAGGSIGPGWTTFSGAGTPGITADNLREPGTAYTGASAGVCPVWVRDVQYGAGSMGAGKYSDSDMVSTNQPWLETANYVTGGGTTISHRLLMIDGTRSLPSINVMAARNNSGVVNVVWTKPGSPTGVVIAVNPGSSSTTTAEPSVELRGNSAVSVSLTADTVLHCGSRFRVTNRSGVHYSTPIAFGGWTTATHLDTGKYTDAALANWFTLADIPTHVVIWLGQNQTATQQTQLEAGVGTAFKDDTRAIIARYEAAAVAAGGSKPRFMLVSQYKTGYNQIRYDTMAQALYELAQESHRYSFLNLFELAGGMSFNTATYLADGIHPNAAGQNFLADTMDVAMRSSFIDYAFAWEDPAELAWSASAVPSCYSASSANVRGVANGIEFFDAPCRLALKARLGDNLYTDCAGVVKYEAKSGTADELVIACGQYNALNARINVATGALTIRRGTATTLASGTTTVSAGDEFRFRVTGPASSRLCEIVRESSGAVLLSATDTSGLSGGGEMQLWAESVSAGGVLRVSNFRAYPLNSTLYTPAASNYQRHPHRCGILLITQYAGETEAQGNVIDALWNPGGQTADWEGFFITYIDPYIALGYRRFSLRGYMGNHLATGVVSGRTTHSGAGAQTNVTNILSERYTDILRDTTRAGLGTVMSDGRLSDGFQTALRSRIAQGCQFILYGCLPPNGRNTSNVADGRSIWPNTAKMHKFWWLAAYNLAQPIGIDIAPEIDPNITPESDLAKGHLDWLRDSCPNQVFLEPHMVQGGGTRANGEYWINGKFGFLSINNPTYAQNRVRNTVDNPGGFYGREDLGGVESVGWVDGTYADMDERLAEAQYDLTKGFVPYVEGSGMGNARLLALLAAGSGGINAGAITRWK